MLSVVFLENLIRLPLELSATKESCYDANLFFVLDKVRIELFIFAFLNYDYVWFYAYLLK